MMRKRLLIFTLIFAGHSVAHETNDPGKRQFCWELISNLDVVNFASDAGVPVNSELIYKLFGFYDECVDSEAIGTIFTKPVKSI